MTRAKSYRVATRTALHKLEESRNLRTAHLAEHREMVAARVSNRKEVLIGDRNSLWPLRLRRVVADHRPNHFQRLRFLGQNGKPQPVNSAGLRSDQNLGGCLGADPFHGVLRAVPGRWWGGQEGLDLPEPGPPGTGGQRGVKQTAISSGGHV